MSSPEHPRLRQLDRVPLERDGESLIVLCDPLELCEPVAVDAEFAPVLDLLAGERSLAQIRQTLIMRPGALSCSLEELEAFVADLSDAGLLDDDRFVARWREAHRDFLAAPTRAPHSAGRWFPAEAADFRAWAEARLGDPDERISDEAPTRALWTPAEPVDLAGASLADTLVELPPPGSLDAVVIFGAERQRGLLPFALTDKAFATPLGEVPPASGLIEALEAEVDWVLREQMRHRIGGAIELPCALLRWIYGEACPPILAVSCAASSLERGARDAENFFDALELATLRRRVLFWASGSLSHCGPAYGGDEAELEEQAELDTACIDAALRGAPDSYLRRATLQARARASGAATAYALLRMIDPELEAELCDYRREKAPGANPGAIGLVGMRWRPL